MRIRLIYLIVALATAGLLSSCGAGKNATYNPYQNTTAGSLLQEEGPSEQARMVIYNAYIDIKVKSTDTLNARLIDIAKRYNGYVQTLGTNNSVIRVQSEKLDSAILQIQGLGKIHQKTVSGEDVTEAYLDMSIRLDNAEKARKRYLELLAISQSVDEAIKVEKELERLNGEIDILKGRMNRTSHLVKYSTINLYIKEKKKPGIVGYVFVYLYKSVKWLFVRN
jgi:hypothetical protein